MKVEGDDVIIRADKTALAKTRRTREVVLASPEDDKRTFLIVGGGTSAVSCGLQSCGLQNLVCKHKSAL